MLPKRTARPILAAAALLLSLTSAAFAQRVYTYVDESGIRVFTNIPPKNLQNPVTTDSGTTTQPRSKNNSPPERPAPPPKQRLPGPRSESAGAGSATPSARQAGIESRSTSSREQVSQESREHFDSIIQKYAGQYKLDPGLVRSIITQESGFNPRAVSRKGAQGLMQLMPSTASRLGVRNPFDPEENIRGGMEHLRFLMDTFDNDLPLSLAAYNAGENLVQRIRKVPDFPETRAYVRSITSHYGRKDMALHPADKTLRYPTTFRFVDSQGVLNLTNIPPTQRPEPRFVGWAASGSSPE